MNLDANNDDGTAIDVLLICALKDEYDQVLNVADGLVSPGWEEHSLPDGWIVADGAFSTARNSPLTIRATHAEHMGREHAQAIASKLIQQQSAHCIAMSGICAGRRDEVALGDVIFADRLGSYDAGKLVVDEDGERRFQGDMFQFRPSRVWAQRMQHVKTPTDCAWLSERPKLPLENQENWVLLRILAGDDPRQHPDFKEACPDWSKVLTRLWEKRGWLEKPLVLTASGRAWAEELNLRYPAELPEPPAFKIHTAPILTGAAVTEDAGIFPRLSNSTAMRKVLGIEMEASALGAFGEIHGLPVLVAKGVSDYGDSFKDDRYRTFAARAAAECLIKLLRESADLFPAKKAAVPVDSRVSPRPSSSGIPNDLILALAECYPDVREARALWERAGGRGSEVENISRPRDLWQRLWQNSMQGSAARPEALLRAALEDYPANAVFAAHLASLIR